MRAWPIASLRPRSGLASPRIAAEKFVGLEPYEFDLCDLDPLGVGAAAQLDHRVAAVPGVCEVQGSVVAHDLEAVRAVEREPAVEVR